MIEVLFHNQREGGEMKDVKDIANQWVLTSSASGYILNQGEYQIDSDTVNNIVKDYLRSDEKYNQVMEVCLELLKGYPKETKKMMEIRHNLAMEFLNVGVRDWLLEGYGNDKPYKIIGCLDQISFVQNKDYFAIDEKGEVMRSTGDSCVVVQLEYSLGENNRNLDLMFILRRKQEEER